MKAFGSIVLILLLSARTAAAAGEEDLFVLSGLARNRIFHINETSGTVLGSVLLPAGFNAFRLSSSGDGAVFVTSPPSNLALKVNPLTGEVLQSINLAAAYGVASNGQNLFVGSSASPPTLHRLAMDGSPANTWGFPIVTTENFVPLDTEFSLTGELLVAANRLRKYDPDTGTELPFRLNRLGTDPQVGFFTIHEGFYYVRNAKQIDRYDLTGTFHDVFASGLSVNPSGGTGTFAGVIQFGPNGNLFVCNFSESVFELNGVTGALMKTIPLDAGDFAFVAIPEPRASVILGMIAAGVIVRRNSNRLAPTYVRLRRIGVGTRHMGPTPMLWGSAFISVVCALGAFLREAATVWRVRNEIPTRSGRFAVGGGEGCATGRSPDARRMGKRIRRAREPCRFRARY